jgi:hypothetical protein
MQSPVILSEYLRRVILVLENNDMGVAATTFTLGMQAVVHACCTD